MLQVSVLNLALQGGGSHGAFTWGVLDALLDDGKLAFEAISGASAGALNAAALASGWAAAQQARRDPREGAREALQALWDEVVALGAYAVWPKRAVRAVMGSSALLAWPGAWPVNPLGLNPLRQVLARRIDFDALHSAQAPRVYVSATHVNSGRAAIFSGRALTLEALLASACLPHLFPAVEIDGEHYWDGGYSVNPALAPFVRGGRAADVLLVQINPVRRAQVPSTGADIFERANELAFNAGLLSQVRAVQHVNQLIDAGMLPTSRVRKLLLHRIDGGEALAKYPQSTRTDADAGLVRELHALGRDAAQAWLVKHRRDLGLRSTVPFAEYEDDTWLDFGGNFKPSSSAVSRLLRFLRWPR